MGADFTAVTIRHCFGESGRLLRSCLFLARLPIPKNANSKRPDQINKPNDNSEKYKKNGCREHQRASQQQQLNGPDNRLPHKQGAETRYDQIAQDLKHV
ncbi:hypothetical protein OEG84_23595 [Hoeflea sp. G2-23]|uniref:Transposase n=1 Tax=Hoeflea algicola TaxID=2983763 RepID=A0ABT3ZBX4_9HYPH|nr:hypothetical protein [Hoeflea algicola]MCY0149300.1 hypothetical protein [Hoeflea algicola]MCY0150605.1 hypothetical protein [Hoeflea algicola]